VIRAKLKARSAILSGNFLHISDVWHVGRIFPDDSRRRLWVRAAGDVRSTVGVPALRTQFETHITIDVAEIRSKDQGNSGRGRSIVAGDHGERAQADSRIVVIRSLDYYSGRAASGVAGQHFLTRQVEDDTDKVSEDPMRALPDSAGEHCLLLLDREARAIGAVGDFVPAQLYVVTARDTNDIMSQRITSDCRLGGVPRAACSLTH
jgi:hypothetical protein